MSGLPRTLSRLERILTMVPWLLEHSGVGIEEVADRFGTTSEEVANDLDVLGYCGLPGYGGGDLIEASVVGDRVSVRMADFFRRPLRLSLREAVTLLLAARAVRSVEGLAESEALTRAVAKLEQALGSNAGGMPDISNVRVAVDLRGPGDEHLPGLRSAASDGRVVRLTYRSASKAQTTTRDVEPWAVVGSGGAWYVQGYCRLADAPRDFRLDRIQSFDVLEERGTHAVPAGGPGPPSYEPAPDDETVVLDVDPACAWVTETIVIDEVTTAGERLRVRFRTPQLDWAARLVLRFGDALRVVSPASLAARVQELATATLARYPQDTEEATTVVAKGHRPRAEKKGGRSEPMDGTKA